MYLTTKYVLLAFLTFGFLPPCFAQIEDYSVNTGARFEYRLISNTSPFSSTSHSSLLTSQDEDEFDYVPPPLRNIIAYDFFQHVFETVAIYYERLNYRETVGFKFILYIPYDDFLTLRIGFNPKFYVWRSALMQYQLGPEVRFGYHVDFESTGFDARIMAETGLNINPIPNLNIAIDAGVGTMVELFADEYDAYARGTIDWRVGISVGGRF